MRVVLIALSAVSDMTQYGANKDDWNNFVKLGLTSDLLPVVSKPGVEVSAKSSLRELGKVPSLYNREHKVVGIAKWTEKKATAKEIESWSEVADYGICLQTRRVRALDVDVTDADKAAVILNTIESFYPRIAVRGRSNSSKFLCAFIVEGDLYKRVMPVAGGMIEFLGNGQQCVVTGCHPSGSRYEWQALGEMFITLTVQEFETLWDCLELTFATGEVQRALPRRQAIESANTGETVNDDILQHLNVLSFGRGGEAFIECPFKDDHSKGEGGKDIEPGTSTAYFPAGTGGYAAGHFKCLHAHCAGREDWEFVKALGIVEAGFKVVTDNDVIVVNGVSQVSEIPHLNGELKQNDRSQTLAVIENLTLILASPTACGRDIRYDTFRDEIVFKTGNSHDKWKPFTDTDYTELRVYLANTGFLPISREMMRDAVHLVAKKRMFDTAIEWLSGLQWDGTERVRTFLPRYMGTEDDDYNKAVGEYMWCAMAGRALEPGCKADAAPILVGPQFIGKTHAVMSMVPDIRYFTEINLEDHDDNLARKMRGKLVAEFAEMRGFQGKLSEATKAFISRQFEEWTPKYMEFVTIYPRRLIFIGTYNNDEFLSDETGNRREFPVKVTRADCDAIKRDRDQLWAEGAEMFRSKGIECFYRSANNLADSIRAEFMITDVWDDSICNFLQENNEEVFTMRDVMWGALAMDTKTMKTYDAMRVGKILKKYGHEKFVKYVNGACVKAWRRKKT